MTEEIVEDAVPVLEQVAPETMAAVEPEVQAMSDEIQNLEYEAEDKIAEGAKTASDWIKGKVGELKDELENLEKSAEDEAESGIEGCPECKARAEQEEADAAKQSEGEPQNNKDSSDNGKSSDADDDYPRDRPDKNTENSSAQMKSERDARNLARNKLGKDPVEVEPNKWRSQDGKWQYRAKPGDLADNHIHLEELDPKTGIVKQNIHLRW